MLSYTNNLILIMFIFKKINIVCHLEQFQLQMLGETIKTNQQGKD